MPRAHCVDFATQITHDDPVLSNRELAELAPPTIVNQAATSLINVQTSDLHHEDMMAFDLFAGNRKVICQSFCDLAACRSP